MFVVALGRREEGSYISYTALNPNLHSPLETPPALILPTLSARSKTRAVQQP